MERDLNLNSLRGYLGFPLRDRDATNRFLVGAALYVASSFIPIIPIIPALGYQYRVMQRVIEGEGPTMPEWSDWGRLFIDGLKLLLIGAVFMLPGMIVYFTGFAIYMISIFAMASSGRNVPPEAGIAFMFSMMIFFIAIMLGMVLTLLGTLPLPIAASHAIAKDRISAAFNIGQWWKILRRAGGNFWIAWIVFYGLFAVIYLAVMLLYMTVILCFVMPLVMGAISFYVFLAGSAIFSSIYRQSAGDLGQVSEKTPPSPTPSTHGRELEIPPADGEMSAANVVVPAAAVVAPVSLTSSASKEALDDTPAAGEMIGVEVANIETQPAANPEPPVSPEIPDPAGDPLATRLVDRNELLETDQSQPADPHATHLLSRAELFEALSPGPDEVDPNATHIIGRGELSGDSVEDPKATRKLPDKE